jgi:hypothetical protein
MATKILAIIVSKVPSPIHMSALVVVSYERYQKDQTVPILALSSRKIAQAILAIKAGNNVSLTMTSIILSPHYIPSNMLIL